MNFKHAMATVLAELDPKPWDFTDSAGATLTVIPAGLRADAGEAEVTIRITASKTLAAEIGIRTADMAAVLAALDTRAELDHAVLFGCLTITPTRGGMELTVVEVDYTTSSPASRYETTATVHLPAEQRLPLKSALERATDVARGWEDDPVCAECTATVRQGTAYCSTRCRNAADRHDTPAGGDRDE